MIIRIKIREARCSQLGGQVCGTQDHTKRAVRVILLRLGSGKVYARETVGIFAITGGVKFFAVNAAELLQAVAFPNFRHGAEKRMRYPLLRRKRLKLPAETGIARQIGIQRKQIFHVDLCPDAQMLFPQCSSAILSEAPRRFAHRRLTLHGKRADQSVSDVSEQQGIDIRKVHHKVFFRCIHTCLLKLRRRLPASIWQQAARSQAHGKARLPLLRRERTTGEMRRIRKTGTTAR